MGDIFYENFGDFLKARNIIQVKAFSESENEDTGVITERMTEEHLNIISEFHKKTMGFNGYTSKRLNNYTGKKVEEYKVYLKKASRDMKRISEEAPRNNFEELVLAKGEEYLERAEKCLKEIYSWDYYGLINRSMKRFEICLGNTYHDNLKRNSEIEVIDIEHCGYNLVECDGINYLNKRKRKGAKLNWKTLISKYCDYEGLGLNSEAFIIAMLSYPYEFMKCYNRYRYKKKDWNNDKYEENLKSAMDKDGDVVF